MGLHLSEDLLCVGDTIAGGAGAAVFKVSIEWEEEDCPADLAQVFHYMCCSINKVSSEDHRGGEVRGPPPEEGAVWVHGPFAPTHRQLFLIVSATSTKSVIMTFV